MTNETNSIEDKIKQKQEEIEEIKNEMDMIAYNESGGYDGDSHDDYDEYDQMINSPQYIFSELQSKREEKEQEILKLKADAEIQERDKIFQKDKKNYKRGILVSDNETENDLLSRRLYSQVLAEYIVSRKTDTPFNIGVFGEWGEGKSSFLKLIEQEVNSLNEEHKINGNYKTHIVRYDASEYSEQNKIWACILKKLFSKFEEERGVKAKVLFSYIRFIKKIKKNLWNYLIRAITIILIISWGFMFNKNIGSIQEFKKILLYGSIGIIPLVMGVINIIIPFIKSQIKIAKPLADMVETNINLPSYTKDLGIRENIKEDLEDLLEVWLKKDKTNKKYKERLIVFVDELDRASEKGILELLEALQLFLSMKQIVIIISVNFRSVCYALRSKFEHINKDSFKESDRIRFCINYLEKYINIPVYLNYDGKYDQYIKKLIFEKDTVDNSTDNKSEVAISDTSNIVKDEEKFVFSSNERKIVNAVLNYINNIRHITPREVKKVVNILILSKHICMNVNEVSSDKEKIEFENYMKWFMFSYFNPITSFNLLQVIDKKEYYQRIEHINFESINNGKDTEKKSIFVENEPNGRYMLTILKAIKVNEIKIFKDISNHFIFNEKTFI
jgi:hypothetical protein